MSNDFQAGSEPLPGYRLIRPKGAPEGVERWEATDPEMRRVVVRLVRLERPLAEDERQGLLALRGVRHPNLVPLLDVIESSGLLGLISPAFEMTLADRLADCRSAGYGGVPRGELARCLEDAAEGLEELHRPRPLPAALDGERLRHGEVRPENLVVDSDQTRLIDGGLSVILSRILPDEAKTPTPWKAPEQLFLGTTTERSDQYALASSFLHLRLGRPPFPIGSTLEERLTRPPDLNGLSIAERPIIERALAKDPTKRWPSASAFASAWTEAIESASGAATNGNGAVPTTYSTNVPPPPPPPVTEPAFPDFSVPAASVAVATAAPPKPAKVAKTPRSPNQNVPVARPAPAKPKVQTAPEEEAQEELLPPESVKGWAWSMAMHAILLLILALMIIPPRLQKAKVIDTRLAGSELGSDLGDQLKGGLGIDTPLAMPEGPTSPLDQVPTITSLPVSQLNLEPPKVDIRPAASAATAKNGGGMNLTNPGQSGNGDGFGVAKFGQGGEDINGVAVKVGDPQFTLIWDGRADLDLHVLEPGGAHIYWESRNGNLGGELDVDDVDGFGPENVYWVQGKGPPGEYQWYVYYYGGLGGVSVPTRWKVRLKHNGTVTIFTGRLNAIGAKSQTYKFKMEPEDAKNAAKKDQAATK